eukprot:GABW01003406.1.p2 GENE.GABW01003406.1~~GABW01003406.1.p2  ORF type:complete len:51 (-),score=0.09 GABW01003406.1:152-304(-)
MCTIIIWYYFVHWLPFVSFVIYATRIPSVRFVYALLNFMQLLAGVPEADG